MSDSTNNVDVVVVGGGLAGLTVAARLADGGARVLLLERSSSLGGRAATQVDNGFHLNLGPHAWYLGGPGTRVLGELGITVPGRTPRTTGAFALYDDVLHTLPVGFISLLTTDLLSVSGKLEAARLLTSLIRMDTSRFNTMTLGQWLRDHVVDERARAVMAMFIRVAAYTEAPHLLSAGTGLGAMQVVLKHNVRYVDGGWQSIVDALHAKARSLGVTIETSAPVARVLHDSNVRGVCLDDGRVIAASHVVIAGSPAVVRELVPDAPPAAVARWSPTPSKAACLDVALARLPRPSNVVAFGIDRPLDHSVHSATADLAPAGSAVVHVAKYLDPSQPANAAALERELDAFMERLQPGWRAHVVERRYLPSMTVTHGIPTAEGGGLAGRAPVEVQGVRGLYLAGDWVGAEGTLANAAVASAAEAARHILSARGAAVAAA